MTAEQQRWQDLALRAGLVFTPNTPIDERSLFAGRVAQVRRIVDVINQKGQHAILFGERGVGKTSLGNVLSQFLPTAGEEGEEVLAPRVNCEGHDTFHAVWGRIFGNIELSKTSAGAGFHAPEQRSLFSPSALVQEEKLTPDAVRRILTVMGQGAIPILIIDEFDRLRQPARRAFADLIKTLSDNAVPATVVLVGVADSVGDLIEEHQSIARALVQVQMPRMDRGEIRQIIQQGVESLGMVIYPAALERIALLSQGLPHYAHLVG